MTNKPYNNDFDLSTIDAQFSVVEDLYPLGVQNSDRSLVVQRTTRDCKLGHSAYYIEFLGNIFTISAREGFDFDSKTYQVNIAERALKERLTRILERSGFESQTLANSPAKLIQVLAPAIAMILSEMGFLSGNDQMRYEVILRSEEEEKVAIWLI